MDDRARMRRARSAWIWMCALLLAVTWGPVFGVHFHKMSANDAATGTVLVVFSPALSARDLFRGVEESGGSLVEPVRWLPRTWVARSSAPGFVGRLKARGAWAVYFPELLSARALLSCSLAPAL